MNKRLRLALKTHTRGKIQPLKLAVQKEKLKARKLQTEVSGIAELRTEIEELKDLIQSDSHEISVLRSQVDDELQKCATRESYAKAVHAQIASFKKKLLDILESAQSPEKNPGFWQFRKRKKSLSDLGLEIMALISTALPSE